MSHWVLRTKAEEYKVNLTLGTIVLVFIISQFIQDRVERTAETPRLPSPQLSPPGAWGAPRQAERENSFKSLLPLRQSFCLHHSTSHTNLSFYLPLNFSLFREPQDTWTLPLWQNVICDVLFSCQFPSPDYTINSSDRGAKFVTTRYLVFTSQNSRCNTGPAQHPL